jgi:hypothetical protein
MFLRFGSSSGGSGGCLFPPEREGFWVLPTDVVGQRLGRAYAARTAAQTATDVNIGFPIEFDVQRIPIGYVLAVFCLWAYVVVFGLR